MNWPICGQLLVTVTQSRYFLPLASILQLRLLGDDSRGRALSVIFQIRVTLNRVGESSSDISYFPGEGERIFWRLWLFYSKVNGSELDTHSPTHELLLLPRCPGRSLTITLGVWALGREVNGRRRRHSPRQVALCLTLPPRAAAQHPRRCASHNSNHPPGHRGSKLTRQLSPPDPEVAPLRGGSPALRCRGRARVEAPPPPRWLWRAGVVQRGCSPRARGQVGFSSVDCRGCRAGLGAPPPAWSQPSLPAASPRCPGEG